MGQVQPKYFRLAKQFAWKSSHRVKIGSVLVRKGQVLNAGYNKIGKTHPKYPYFLHAEMDACLGVGHRDLRGAVLYLFRINSLGVTGNCRPCSVCQSVLKELGIRDVFYTTGHYDLQTLIDSRGQTLAPEYEGMRL